MKKDRRNAARPAKDPYDIDIQACSATDCTGLIPAAPRDEAEREHYEALYPYLARADKADIPDAR